MKKTLLTTMLLLTAATSFAENNLSGELLLGFAKQETNTADVFSLSGDDTSYGIRGYYELNNNFSLELGYFYFGKIEEEYYDIFGYKISDEIETTAISAGIQGITPITNNFSLVAHLGLAMWEYTLTETDSYYPDFEINLNEDGHDIYYAIGTQFNLKDNFYVGLEYMVIPMDVSILGISIDHDVKNISLSIGKKY